jgi:hypothetical protein
MAKKSRKLSVNLGKAGGKGKKQEAQTGGQFERDPKGRKGQYTAAGDSALTKK